MRVQSTLALAVIASAIVACGGGGGGSSPTQAVLPGGTTTVTPTTAPTNAATQPASVANNASATMTVVVPKSTGSSSSRRAQNVASGSQSITMQLIQTGNIPVTGVAQTFPLTSTTAGCTTVSAGLSCTFALAAPVGDDVFTAQTYSSANGTGSLLSTGAVRISVAANATNTASLSLDGTIASVYVASSSTFLGTYNSTTVTTARLFIIALDSQGNTILNPTVFNTPITLQQTFSYGYNPDVTLSVAASGGGTSSTSTGYGTVTVNTPSDVITATYLNATSGSPSVQIAAYIGSAPPAPTTTQAPSPIPSSVPHLSMSVYAPTVPTGIAATYNPWNIVGLNNYSYNQLTGGSGIYSISSSTCSSYGTFYISGPYIYGDPSQVGSCSLTIADSQGDAPLTLPITITTTTVTGH